MPAISNSRDRLHRTVRTANESNLQRQQDDQNKNNIARLGGWTLISRIHFLLSTVLPFPHPFSCWLWRESIVWCGLATLSFIFKRCWLLLRSATRTVFCVDWQTWHGIGGSWRDVWSGCVDVSMRELAYQKGGAVVGVVLSTWGVDLIPHDIVHIQDHRHCQPPQTINIAVLECEISLLRRQYHQVDTGITHQSSPH
jgi:hypothetical protein